MSAHVEPDSDPRAGASPLAERVGEALAGERVLGAVEAQLLELGICSCSSVLDMEGARVAARNALGEGATPEQVTEVLVTVSVLGMHTLTSAIPVVAAELRDHGAEAMTAPLDDRRRLLHEAHVGDDGYWDAFERHLPGFLDGLLRLAPDTFELFFAYSALPWRSGALAPRLKEQLYVAIDATPGHVYAPGLRLHVANARKLGTDDSALAEVLVRASRNDRATLDATLAALEQTP